MEELDRERRERVWKTMDRLNATLGGNRPHLERRVGGRGLETPGGVSIAVVGQAGSVYAQ